ncbi:hypothetical protein DPMN_127603 [Dreissena polymorpha]|uniref:Uncharacterized protein n=1 Tax=Dreissena polymorpha TaxID=45954 RepID=A0A9D4H5J7_DREPO|nr:hypothetical protein DPMN_127603 [Dreissena polymorpha]
MFCLSCLRKDNLEDTWLYIVLKRLDQELRGAFNGGALSTSRQRICLHGKIRRGVAFELCQPESSSVLPCRRSLWYIEITSVYR